MKYYSITVSKGGNPKVSYYENIGGKISRKAKDNFGKKTCRRYYYESIKS